MKKFCVVLTTIYVLYGGLSSMLPLTQKRRPHVRFPTIKELCVSLKHVTRDISSESLLEYVAQGQHYNLCALLVADLNKPGEMLQPFIGFAYDGEGRTILHQAIRSKEPLVVLLVLWYVWEKTKKLEALDELLAKKTNREPAKTALVYAQDYMPKAAWILEALQNPAHALYYIALFREDYEGANDIKQFEGGASFAHGHHRFRHHGACAHRAGAIQQKDATHATAVSDATASPQGWRTGTDDGEACKHATHALAMAAFAPPQRFMTDEQRAALAEENRRAQMKREAADKKRKLEEKLAKERLAEAAAKRREAEAMLARECEERRRRQAEQADRARELARQAHEENERRRIEALTVRQRLNEQLARQPGVVAAHAYQQPRPQRDVDPRQYELCYQQSSGPNFLIVALSKHEGRVGEGVSRKEFVCT